MVAAVAVLVTSTGYAVTTSGTERHLPGHEAYGMRGTVEVVPAG